MLTILFIYLKSLKTHVIIYQVDITASESYYYQVAFLILLILLPHFYTRLQGCASNLFLLICNE